MTDELPDESSSESPKELMIVDEKKSTGKNTIFDL